MQTYKQIVVKLREKIDSQRATWHEITSMAVSLFDDRDLRADLNLVDDFAAVAWLDEQFRFTEECGLSFLALKAILGRFPQPEQWRGKTLLVLHDEAITADKADAPRETVSRERVTKKELEARDKQIAELQYQVKYAEDRAKSADELRAELAEAKAEIRELRRENSELRRSLSAYLETAAA